jgi:hypothetical protein
MSSHSEPGSETLCKKYNGVAAAENGDGCDINKNNYK